MLHLFKNDGVYGAFSLSRQQKTANLELEDRNEQTKVSVRLTARQLRNAADAFLAAAERIEHVSGGEENEAPEPINLEKRIELLEEQIKELRAKPITPVFPVYPTYPQPPFYPSSISTDDAEKLANTIANKIWKD